MTDATRHTVRLTAEQKAAIESAFARFEAERPGQRATMANVLRTLALEYAARVRAESEAG